MTEEIRQIGMRIKGLREIYGVSVETLAKECGTTPEVWASFEAGVSDIPVSILHTLSRKYNVDMTILLTGEELTQGRSLTRKAKVWLTESSLYAQSWK